MSQMCKRFDLVFGPQSIYSCLFTSSSIHNMITIILKINTEADHNKPTMLFIWINNNKK